MDASSKLTGIGDGVTTSNTGTVAMGVGDGAGVAAGSS